MKIQSFEDLECWKKSRELVKRVYKFTHNDLFKKDYGLKDQIQRAAISVMSNVAEGFDNLSDREFIKFLRYSIRSASEVQSQLYVALDLAYLSKIEFELAYSLAHECKNLCKGFIRYLNQSKK